MKDLGAAARSDSCGALTGSADRLLCVAGLNKHNGNLVATSN